VNDIVWTFFGLDSESARAATGWRLDWVSSWPAWVVVLIVGACVAYIYQLYRHEASKLIPRDRILLTAVRVLAVLILLVMIFEPVVIWDMPASRDASLIVMLDDSKSMALVDPYEGSDELTSVVRVLWPREMGEWKGSSPRDLPVEKREELTKLSRADLVNRVLGDENRNFVVPLAALFNTKVYVFSDELREVATGFQSEDGKRAESTPDELSKVRLTPRGDTTRAGDLLHRAVVQSRGRPAGIVIVTDGGRNVGAGLQSTASLLKERGIKVYAVGVGDATPQRDVAVRNVNANRIVHLSDEVTIDFELEASGFREEKDVTVKLLCDGEEVLLRKDGRQVNSVEFTVKADLPGEDDAFVPPPAEKCSISFQPDKVGEFTYTIVAEPLSEERVRQNNAYELPLRVDDAKIKVLYVEGTPRWEYRYLKNALVRDETVEVACFLADADFDFPQEGNRSIQLVPTEEKELAKYDVIILGDVPRGRQGLTDEQLALFHKFVDKLGGGFIMQAGILHAPRDYRHTPIEKMLPVDIDAAALGQGTTIEWRPVLTPTGERHAMTRFEPDLQANRVRWQELPGLFWHFPVRRARPGGKILLAHPTEKGEEGPRPLLITQDYGKGKTAFLAVDSTWRWRSKVGDVHFMRFWGQVIRELSQEKLLGTSKRFRVTTERNDYLVGQKVKVTAEVLDREFEPSTAAEIRARIESAEGDVRVVKLLPNAQFPGTFEAEVALNRPSRYRVMLELDEPGVEEEIISHHFLVAKSNREFENPRMRREDLKTLAATTGGEYFDIQRARFIPDVIRRLKATTVRDVRDELWNAPMLFTLFCMLFLGELGYRKLRKLL